MRPRPNGISLARDQKTDEEILKEIRVGDVVSCLLHPVGPGTEEYRRSHGHECELKIVQIREACKDFDGEYHIEDMEALFMWITILDGVNDGSQIGESHVIPDIQINCIEDFVERAPTEMNDEVKAAIDVLADEVTANIYERDEPGSISEVQFLEARGVVLNEIIDTVANRLKEGR